MDRTDEFRVIVRRVFEEIARMTLLYNRVLRFSVS